MPAWLLAVVVVAALTGSAWLFVRDAIRDEPESKKPASEAEREQADAVLTVPDEDAPTDERRRGQAGRDRIDPKVAVDDPTADATKPPLDSSLPAVFGNLRDRTVALAPASGTTTGDVGKLFTVGGIRVACGSTSDTDSIERLARELALLDRLEAVLKRAGATVVRVDGERGSVGCVDARVRAIEQADFAIVARAGDDKTGRVFSARPATKLDASSAAQSTRLAAELAGALDIASVTPAGASADRSMLASAGSIDLPEGASAALVELGEDDTEASRLDELAMMLARALAATASRADEPASS